MFLTAAWGISSIIEVSSIASVYLTGVDIIDILVSIFEVLVSIGFIFFLGASNILVIGSRIIISSIARVILSIS